MVSVRERVARVFPVAEGVPEGASLQALGLAADIGLRYLVDGEVRTWSGPSEPVLSPVCLARGGSVSPAEVGRTALLDAAEALAALAAAVRAWDRGAGRWPRARVAERIAAVAAFRDAMRGEREPCVRLLMWEIGKTRADAEREFDRTVAYIDDTLEAVKEADRAAGRFSSRDGILAQIRRAPLGVVLSLGPFNYPLNETFSTLIPALVMGNTVVAKLPRFGKLCWAPLLEAFARSFPRGVVNVINGDGATVVGPLLESGAVAALAFIGTSRVANLLKKQHPRPNRLRSILALEAKNPAIVLADADLDVAVRECVSGALSYNGQRCTALKLLLVERAVAERFVARLAEAVEALPFGMPWEPGVRITPLPEPGKPARLAAWVEEARGQGGLLANPSAGAANATFYFPAVVYPVAPGTALHEEEQFGPVVPVRAFDSLDEVGAIVTGSRYGQQVSVFGRDPGRIGPLVDVLANQVCRVNLNAACQRGPDVYPFTGRKDSAEGTLSVADALRAFSIRSMVAAGDGPAGHELLRGMLTGRTSNFVNTDYVF